MVGGAGVVRDFLALPHGGTGSAGRQVRSGASRGARLQQHLAGDPPGRIAQVRATTTTASSGPITGRNPARSFRSPEGRRAARTTSSAHRATMTPAGGRWIPRTARELGQVDLVAGAAHAPFPPGTPSTWMVGSAMVGP